MTYRTFLAIIQNNDDAERVLDFAIPLAAAAKGHLIGLHTEAIPIAYSSPVGFPEAEFMQATSEVNTARAAKLEAMFKERAQAAGAMIRCGTSVLAIGPGARLSVTGPEGPTAIVARRAMLATGVRESSRHARLISGDRPVGVLTTGTLQAMVHLHGLAPFARPVIVGTELVALSSLMTCRKAGIRPVAMLGQAADERAVDL